MSYCRWNSDNWKCDLYCYNSVDGYIIHVAGKRHKGPIPKTPDFMTADPKEWLKAHKIQMNYLENAKLEKIDLPYAGQTFQESTLKDFLTRIKELKQIGYHIPQNLIETIEKELE